MSSYAYKDKQLSKNAMKKYRKISGIYIKAEFYRLIEYERIRSDRESSAFSLVLFNLERKFGFENRHFRTAVAELRETIRLIDHLGWFEENELGLLLPSTDHEGARTFVDSLPERAPGLDFPMEMYTYPDQWIKRRIIDFPDAPKISKNVGIQHDKIFCDEDNGGLLISSRMREAFAHDVPAWKRILDILGSTLGILLLSPLFLLIVVFIKVVSPGPALYSQDRVGHKGRSFRFFKFRTMHVDNDTSSHSTHLKELIGSDKPMTKLDNRNDPRIIPGGKLLRKFAIDELPQLFNILKGEMSLVGPRPCIQYEAKEYLRWHAHRFDILPGLTGLWQVSGKNKLSFKQMIRLDISYARNMSIGLDILIILKTIPAICSMALDSVMSKIRSKAIGDINQDISEV